MWTVTLFTKDQRINSPDQCNSTPQRFQSQVTPFEKVAFEQIVCNTSVGFEIVPQCYNPVPFILPSVDPLLMILRERRAIGAIGPNVDELLFFGVVTVRHDSS